MGAAGRFTSVICDHAKLAMSPWYFSPPSSSACLIKAGRKTPSKQPITIEIRSASGGGRGERLVAVRCRRGGVAMRATGLPLWAVLTTQLYTGLGLGGGEAGTGRGGGARTERPEGRLNAEACLCDLQGGCAEGDSQKVGEGVA